MIALLTLWVIPWRLHSRRGLGNEVELLCDNLWVPFRTRLLSQMELFGLRIIYSLYVIQCVWRSCLVSIDYLCYVFENNWQIFYNSYRIIFSWNCNYLFSLEKVCSSLPLNPICILNSHTIRPWMNSSASYPLKVATFRSRKIYRCTGWRQFILDYWQKPPPQEKL